MSEPIAIIGKTLRVLNALGRLDFSPKSLEEVAALTDLPATTAWRILKTLEHHGWTHHIQAERVWTLAPTVAEFAFAYKRSALARVHAVESEYLTVSGEVLRP